MTVLIAGAADKIARRIVQKLTEEGHAESDYPRKVGSKSDAEKRGSHGGSTCSGPI
jgi:hypothetical protein